MDISGVIGARSRGDGGNIEKLFFHRQKLIAAGRHEHDIDESLVNHLSHQVAILSQAANSSLGIWLAPRGQDAKSHISILGICQDEVFGSRRICVYVC
jgi:hypothetical protein